MTLGNNFLGAIPPSDATTPSSEEPLFWQSSNSDRTLVVGKNASLTLDLDSLAINGR